MNTEEHDDLWQLLGKARTPSVSPYFSRNVLRVIREEKQEKSGVMHWLRTRWAAVAVATCAVAISAVGIVRHQRHSSVPQPEQMTLLAQQFSSSPDYQVVNHLDELLDSEKNSVWLEN